MSASNTRGRAWRWPIVGFAFLMVPFALAQGREEAIPPYQAVAGIAGTLSIQAGDIPGNLAAVWLDDFQRYYPNVTVALGAQGSTAGASGLIAASEGLAFMSRPMDARELSDFKAKHGYRPMAIRIAHSAIVIYVNGANPLQRITLPQLDAMYSTTRRCGGGVPIRNWQQLGVDTWPADGQIHLFGPDDSSGVSELFRRRVLCDGDIRPGVDQLAGPSAVEAAVAGSRRGLGFAELGPMPGVKALAVASTAQTDFVAPTVDNIRRGRYPLSHDLEVYVYHLADKTISPLAREFIRMVLSAEGQKAVSEMGYIPLQASEIQRQLARLQ